MENKPNYTIRAIRTKRKLSMAAFARMLEISTSYLSLLEAGKRDINPQIIDKIDAILIDLTPAERQILAKTKEIIEKPDLEQMQKTVMRLISDYFYRLANKIIDGIAKLKQEIIDLINQLDAEYGQNMRGLFQEV